ncbi:APC family permease [Thiomicrorhabdus arctica]|uniref:APC family permease n=1 Tax=Thiomicrorhabdus arctica TaxID=131540 RepID=UPI001FE09391|nr:APC family permease [Thiomicrorhabdus arctica]
MNTRDSIHMPQSTRLKRVISLPMLVLYGLGTTIGAGIYALVGELAGVSGYLAPAAFLVASILAGITALSFAELSSRYPWAAGAALYTREGLGSERFSTLVGLLVVSAGLVSSAALVNAFAGYLNHLIAPWVELDRMTIVLLATLFLGLFALWGILQSILITTAMTLLGIAGLIIIIYVGHGALADLSTEWPKLIPSADFTSWGFVFAGTLLAFYAFIGFEDMVDVAEEVKDVKRNLPLAILITLGFTTVLYMLIMTIAVLSMPPEVFAQSSAPMAFLYQYHTGEDAKLISIIGLFAIIDGVLIQMIMASRVLYGLSSRGQLPALLSRVHPKTQTPLYATGLTICSVLILSLVGRLGSLAELTSIIMLIVFSLVNLSLWRIKQRVPNNEGHINLPPWISLTAFMLSSTFVTLEISKLFLK